MRKFTLLLLFTSAFYFSNAQTEPEKVQDTRESYLSKSKSANSTGFVTLSAGLALVGISLATENKSPSLSSATGLIGLVSLIGSIPFFIKAGKYKHKAKLALNELHVSAKGFYCTKKIPAITLSIAL